MVDDDVVGAVVAVDGFGAGRTEERERERKSKEDEYKHNKAGLAVWLAPADAQWGEGRLDGGIFKLY